MTIYTTEHALNPEKKEHSDDNVDVEIQFSDEKKALTEPSQEEDYSVYNATTVPVITVNRAAYRQRQIRRRNMWLLPLLLFGMIVGISLCIFGSMQLWSGIYYVDDGSSYVGRCGVGIVDMSRYNASGRPKALQYKAGAPVKSYVEDIKIDGPVETMTLPKQGNSSAAILRHDFDKKSTAIRDELRKLCLIAPFIEDMLIGLVPNPLNFTLYLKEIEVNHDTPYVFERDEFFEAGDEVDDKSELGVPLSDLCGDLKTYKVNPMSSLQDVTTTTTAPVDMNSPDWMYSMYPGGDALFNYNMFGFPDYVYNYDYGR